MGTQILLPQGKWELTKDSGAPLWWWPAAGGQIPSDCGKQQGTCPFMRRTGARTTAPKPA